jgi:subtilisin family serine protease
MRSRLQAGAVPIVAALMLSACGGGGGGVTPTATPTPDPTPATTAACPSSGSLPSSVAAGASSEAAARRIPLSVASAKYVPGALAVTYTAADGPDRIDSLLATVHGVRTADLDFSRGLGIRTRVISVDPSRTDAALVSLRALPGVQAVSRVAYRHRMTVTANDPYYGGFGAPSPYFESSGTPGQWDMHVINVEGGWNAVTSSAPVTGATIAVIDTGVDVTHPELTGGKITRTRCFVTYPTSAAQTTGAYVTDTDGHGTDVAGIADADTNNGLGFASVAFGAPMFAYRIFPTDPAGGCDSAANKNNPQCSSDTVDEASAIDDAVNNGAKVINLSLGGGQTPCDTTDPEYKAVEYAIQHNVVVVAAAGNGNASNIGQNYLTCPAGDPGVIAVGASALDDSVPTTVAEKIASYSNYLTNDGNSTGGAFLVAPGGDSTGTSDSDQLHWIENIYSSTAVVAGLCTGDYPTDTGTTDCRIGIEGTSQATPHVAGAASLILAVRPNYTPAQVATALCASANKSAINDARAGCGRLDVGAAVQYALTH